MQFVLRNDILYSFTREFMYANKTPLQNLMSLSETTIIAIRDICKDESVR